MCGSAGTTPGRGGGGPRFRWGGGGLCGGGGRRRARKGTPLGGRHQFAAFTWTGGREGGGWRGGASPRWGAHRGVGRRGEWGVCESGVEKSRSEVASPLTDGGECHGTDVSQRRGAKSAAGSISRRHNGTAVERRRVSADLASLRVPARGHA